MFNDFGLSHKLISLLHVRMLQFLRKSAHQFLELEFLYTKKRDPREEKINMTH